MSGLTDSGHKHGKIKESKCREQFVFKKLTPEGPFPSWLMTPKWGIPWALQAPKWARLPDKGLYSSHCGPPGPKLKGYASQGLRLAAAVPPQLCSYQLHTYKHM